ncbi:MAG: PDZ domain-containing protein, partial [Lachnospiraceae bacterium]|nr:PDZ domain-containing protein [Lachnospiraceae bacterium]
MERNDENRNEPYVTEEIHVYRPHRDAAPQGPQYQNPGNPNPQYQNPRYQGSQYQGNPYQNTQYRGPQYQNPQYRREEISDPNLVVRTNTQGKKSRKSGGLFLAALIGFLAAALLATLVFVAVYRVKKENEDPTNPTRKPAQTTQADPDGKETRSPWGSSDEKVVSDDLEDKLEEIRERLDEYYLFEEEAGGTDFDTALIRAYVDALGDPYTYYYTKEELEELFEEDSGTYSGIGVMIQQDPESMSITITNVFKGSPAEAAGLKIGDVLYKVGDRECGKTDINVVVTWVRGETGTSVDLTVYRPSINDYVTVTSRRETIETPT